jgi:protocatechuate 3,4-dioxygenase beta subunit
MDEEKVDVVRRALLRGGLWGAAGLAVGCVLGRRRAEASPPPPDAAEPLVCVPTEPNIEGPFYKPGAPLRSGRLVEPGTPGTPLVLSGRVLSARCASLDGATLDVWHADHAGQYDLEGFGCRGVFRAAADGRFRLETIVPGRYLNGSRYRPAHIHLKLAARGHSILTTQLYFDGDPYNRGDPFIRRTLIQHWHRTSHGVAMRVLLVLA